MRLRASQLHGGDGLYMLELCNACTAFGRQHPWQKVTNLRQTRRIRTYNIRPSRSGALAQGTWEIKHLR